jgi:hypothetical protein
MLEEGRMIVAYNPLENDADLIDVLDRTASALRTGIITNARVQPTKPLVEVIERARDRIIELTIMGE